MAAWQILKLAAADCRCVETPKDGSREGWKSVEPNGARKIPTVLLGQLVATVLMTGVIWYVQLVHYPLMDGWPHDDFPRWEAAHREQTGLVVVPAMLAEGLAVVLILAWRPVGVPVWLAWTGAGLLLAIWVSTFAIQVPLHEQLSAGWDEAAHRRLVQSNWLRTVLWSARSAVAVVMLRGWGDAEKLALPRPA